MNAYIVNIAYVSFAGNRSTKKKRHKDSSESSGSNGSSIKRCGAAKGDATWAGAQETHRWAWRLSLRGAPGRRDMKLYTDFAVEGIFLFLSPPIASLAYATIFRLQSRPAAAAAYGTAVRINKKSSFSLSCSFKSARFFRHELRSTRRTPPSHLGGGQSAS